VTLPTIAPQRREYCATRQTELLGKLDCTLVYADGIRVGPISMSSYACDNSVDEEAEVRLEFINQTQCFLMSSAEMNTLVPTSERQCVKIKPLNESEGGIEGGKETCLTLRAPLSK